MWVYLNDSTTIIRARLKISVVRGFSNLCDTLTPEQKTEVATLCSARQQKIKRQISLMAF